MDRNTALDELEERQLWSQEARKEVQKWPENWDIVVGCDSLQVRRPSRSDADSARQWFAKRGFVQKEPYNEGQSHYIEMTDSYLTVLIVTPLVAYYECA